MSEIQSFEILDGRYHVMFSAPHAVEQVRDGQTKVAEYHTGEVARQLQELGWACIVKTRNDQDDANYDSVHPYKTSLQAYIREKQIKVLFDLHELSPVREMEICIGTGYGKNLQGEEKVLELVRKAFAANGITAMTVDEPFAASFENTVSAYIARECRIPAVQIEMNAKLFFEPETRRAVEKALLDLADTCEELL